MFLFLFLLVYLPSTFWKECGKNILNSCVMVGSHVYLKLGEFFLGVCSLAALSALQDFRLGDASKESKSAAPPPHPTPLVGVPFMTWFPTPSPPWPPLVFYGDRLKDSAESTYRYEWRSVQNNALRWGGLVRKTDFRVSTLATLMNYVTSTKVHNL